MDNGYRKQMPSASRRTLVALACRMQLHAVSDLIKTIIDQLAPLSGKEIWIHQTFRQWAIAAVFGTQERNALAVT